MRPALALALVAALLLAAPAQAGRVTFGSDLTAAATRTQEHPRDWAAWGNGVVVPAQGEVAMVQVKGTVLKPEASTYPPFVFHVVVLRPQPDGTKKLMVASEDLPFPFGGDDQRVSTFDLQSMAPRMCAVEGDLVAIATSGGFGPGAFADGHRVQMFGDVSAASYGLFEAPPDDTFQVGDSVGSTNVAGQELLMRVTLGTDADARPFCRDSSTPGPGPAPKGTPSIVGGRAKVKRRRVRIKVRCDGGPCQGMLRLRREGVLYGSTEVTLAAGERVTVTLKLTQRLPRRRFVVSASLGGKSRNFVLRRSSSR